MMTRRTPRLHLATPAWLAALLVASMLFALDEGAQGFAWTSSSQSCYEFTGLVTFLFVLQVVLARYMTLPLKSVLARWLVQVLASFLLLIVLVVFLGMAISLFKDL